MAWRWLITMPLNFVAFLLLYSYPEGITETEEPWRRHERGLEGKSKWGERSEADDANKYSEGLQWFVVMRQASLARPSLVWLFARTTTGGTVPQIKVQLEEASDCPQNFLPTNHNSVFKSCSLRAFSDQCTQFMEPTKCTIINHIELSKTCVNDQRDAQFFWSILFHSFLSALRVSKESSRSSSGARYNILYYTHTHTHTHTQYIMPCSWWCTTRFVRNM